MRVPVYEGPVYIWLTLAAVMLLCALLCIGCHVGELELKTKDVDLTGFYQSQRSRTNATPSVVTKRIIPVLAGQSQVVLPRNEDGTNNLDP